MKVADTIREKLADVKVVDPHCHVRPNSPAADTLADIVLYHHVWIELVSSGMGQYEVTRAGLPHELAAPEMDPAERVRRAIPYLRNIANTTVGTYLRWLLCDLYGLDGELSEANLESALNSVAERAGDPEWIDEVLVRRCGIEHSITVEGGDQPPVSRIHRGVEAGCVNIASGKNSPREMLASYERDFGREISSSADLREYIRRYVGQLPAGIRFLGIWTLPSLTEDRASDDDVDATLRKVREGESLTAAETGGYSYFTITALLDVLRETPVRTIQLICGAEVLPPHRSITHWDPSCCGAVARIAGDYEDFHFNLSSAADHYTQDLGILAKHIPNISVAGYWWHTLYPFYIRKSVETRIDMVPMNKIIAFFSDAYHIEWCHPKLKMVKQIWAEVLTERVGRGWLTTAAAEELIEKAFYENPMRLYLS
ncbi:MAG: hypothetical protein U9R79_09065 [Armatimonadota bacterium]|nr:hypothetical protein [Armatimonadota bacterium]